jgi:hypothetical protein
MSGLELYFLHTAEPDKTAHLRHQLFPELDHLRRSECRIGADGRGRPASQIYNDLVARLAAANQSVAFGRRLQRFGPIAHSAGDQRALAGVTNAGAARPPHRNIAGLRHSSKLLNFGSHATLRPLRAKETRGPAPMSPAGGCGFRAGASAIPGVMDAPGPKTSECTRLAATPQAARPAVKSLRNVTGPHR